LAVTIIQIPHYGWGAELSGKYNERSKINSYQESFQFAGNLIASSILLVLNQFLGVAEIG